MASMESLLCTAALLLAAFTLNVKSQGDGEVLCGRFEVSCLSIDYANGANVSESYGTSAVVSALCPSGGQYINASIDLNDYVGNIDGELNIGANFTESCNNHQAVKLPDYEFGGETVYTLAADCLQSNGSSNPTTLFVGLSVGSVDGVLTWVNCV